MIWYGLILISVCFAIENFDFFYQEEISQIFYENNDQYLIKVDFPFTKDMKQSDEIISKIYYDICKPFDLSPNNFSTRANSLYIQIDDLYTWIGKFSIYYNDTISIRNSYQAYKPEIFDTNTTLTIDADYTDQKFKNMKLFSTTVVSIFEKTKTLQELKANKESLLIATIALELLVNDFKQFVALFYRVYQTLILAKQKHISEMLQEHLVNKTTNIDLEKTSIIQGGTVDNNPTFIIKSLIKSSPIEYYALKPLTYYGFSLEKDYYKRKDNVNIKKFYLDDNVQPIELHNIEQCLIGLNSKNYLLIYEHCVFIRSDEKFSTIDKGLILNNGTNSIITQLTSFFNEQIKITDFPVIINFNGTFVLKDDNYKDISIKKHYKNEIKKSSLSKSTLEQFRATLFTQQTNAVVTLLEEEFEGLLLSIGTFTILIIFAFISNCAYIKFKSKQTNKRPQERLILNKLRANANPNIRKYTIKK